MLSKAQIEATGNWLAGQQADDGEIAWWPGKRWEAWDHCHAAMGLTLADRHEEAYKAYRFLTSIQLADGAWHAERQSGAVTDATQESNHAAFFASAIWFNYLATGDAAFVAEVWPAVERATNFVVRLQQPSGAVAWALGADGEIWRSPLLTGSCSVHGSLVCAERIADLLGYSRPRWGEAREQLATVIRESEHVFDDVDLPDKPGRFSMDWYYPVLGGIVRGDAAGERLFDPEKTERFLREGYGVKCVVEEPWYTVAETCEFVAALIAAGYTERAREIFSWMDRYRIDDGSYWTGIVLPEHAFWPEPATWTASALLLADDALRGDTPTSDFFRSLGDEAVVEEDKQKIAS